MLEFVFAPLANPWFYAVAIPALFIVGLTKGGLGGLGAVFGVPIMSLVINPVQAAAIMLPIMIVMDVMGVVSWRAKFHPGIMKAMLPGAIVGVAVGWFFAASLSSDWIRIIVALVALGFLLNEWFGTKAKTAEPRKVEDTRAAGAFWGAASGFTSFVAHAGSPPYQVYTQPMRLEPTYFASTAICFFAVVNAIKLIPYFALGQFDATNLATSAVLLPLVPLSVYTGVWLAKRIPKRIFYAVLNSLLFILSLQLMWQGVSGLV
ncbi:MAG: sulfite exporter TauE/SafE family protein [Pseudomonadota bacterium]